jgi:hypothetical protein
MGFRDLGFRDLATAASDRAAPGRPSAGPLLSSASQLLLWRQYGLRGGYLARIKEMVCIPPSLVLIGHAASFTPY